MSATKIPVSRIFAEEGARLRNFVRRYVSNPSDAEDIVQDVFYKLLEANRMLMPIDHVTGWLFRVARNRVIDLFRRQRSASFSQKANDDDGDGQPRFEDLLPSPDAGPEALYIRNLLLEELELALGDLPEDQRYVFVAHEVEGRSFRDLSSESGINLNTLLARKRYAVLHLRRRLQKTYDELKGK